MKAARAAVVCALLAACAGAPASGPELDLRALTAPRTVGYGVWIDGVPVGWSTLQMRVEGERFVRETTLEMRLPGGRASRSASYEEYALSPPFPLLLRREQRQSGEGQSRVELRGVGGGFVVDAGEGAEPRFLAGAYGLVDALAEMAWIRRQPRPGDVLVRRILDTDALQIAHSRSELVAVRPPRAGDEATRYEVVTRADDGSTERVTFDDAGIASSWRLGTLELRRAGLAPARAAALAGGAATPSLVPVDRPLGDPRRLRRLVVIAAGPGVAALSTGGAQTVTPVDGGVRVEVDADAPGPRAHDDELARASRPTVRFPADDPELRALALEAAAGAASARAIAERLVPFVAAFVADSTTDADHLRVRQIARDRVGDCSDHVALLVTLARACGVPARPVTGLQYVGDEGLGFAPHDWCEIAVDGRWLAVDPTWNEVPASAARLRFGADELAGSGTTRLELRLLSAESR